MRTTKLSLHCAASENKNCNSDEGATQEEHYRKVETSGRDFVFFIVLFTVDDCDDPGKTEAKEDVDGVGASDVSDCGICVLALSGSSHACEGIGEGSSDGDKGDRGHTRLQAHHATHHACDLAYHGGQSTNEADGGNEAGDAAAPMGRRTAGKQHFPADRKEVQHSVHSANVFNLAVLVPRGMETASVLELLAPRDVLLSVDPLQKLLQSLLLLRTFTVTYDLDHASVLLRNFNRRGFSVVQLHSENFVPLFAFSQLALNDGNYNLLFAFLVTEDESAFDRLVVFACSGGLGGVVNVNGFVLDLNFAVSSLHTVDDNNACSIVCGVTQRFFLFEHEHTRLVIVQNCHTGASVLSN